LLSLSFVLNLDKRENNQQFVDTIERRKEKKKKSGYLKTIKESLFERKEKTRKMLLAEQLKI
jgi:hypothetical protein